MEATGGMTTATAPRRPRLIEGVHCPDSLRWSIERLCHQLCMGPVSMARLLEAEGVTRLSELAWRRAVELEKELAAIGETEPLSPAERHRLAECVGELHAEGRHDEAEAIRAGLDRDAKPWRWPA